LQTLLGKSDFRKNIDKKKDTFQAILEESRGNAQTDKREVKQWKITRALENATI